jgi:hypothetical protein
VKKVLLITVALAGAAKILSRRKSAAKVESAALWREAVQPPAAQ